MTTFPKEEEFFFTPIVSEVHFLFSALDLSRVVWCGVVWCEVLFPLRLIASDSSFVAVFLPSLVSLVVKAEENFCDFGAIRSFVVVVR